MSQVSSTLVEQTQAAPVQASQPVPLDAELLKLVAGGATDGPHDNW